MNLLPEEKMLKTDSPQKPDVSAIMDELNALHVQYQSLKAQYEQAERQKHELSWLLHDERAKVVQLSYRIKNMRSGIDGALLAPVQFVRNLRRKWGKFHRVHLIPINEIESLKSGRWRALGNDPQFLLSSDKNWGGLQGWYWLDLVAAADHALDVQIFFDFGKSGHGYTLRDSVNLLIPAHQGAMRIPLYVPANCRSIRFDPCQSPMQFSLTLKGLTQLDKPPSVAPEYQALMQVYTLMGGGGGNWAAVLSPNSGISSFSNNTYQWLSENGDPWFRMNFSSETLIKGWYRVDLLLRSEIRRGMAKIYVDFGKGYNEQDTVRLPYTSGEAISRVVYFPASPLSMRFDPVECPTPFSIDTFNNRAISADEAKQSILACFSEDQNKFQGKSQDEIWASIQKTASKLGSLPLEVAYEMYQAQFMAGQSSINYAEWIQRNEERWFDAELIRKRQSEFSVKPLISIIMPVYNTPEPLLRSAIDSVLKQSYKHWELCIADDASPDPATRQVLENYAQRDSRIKVAFREKNGHISAASNSALGLAIGDFVALFDHDDELAEHALHYVVDCLDRHSNAKIVYTDEDKIDTKGVRSDPHFKPDWNPDLFFSQNYVSHLGVYRRDLIGKIGGFRVGVEGSQDQDLLLRCLPFVKNSEIQHVAMVLYHWRIVQGSTALDTGEKSYTTDAGIRALRDFFASQGSGVKVEAGLAPNLYRLHYPIPETRPLVSLLIPTRDHVDLLRVCVSGIIERSDYRNFEIIIIDNESTDPETLRYFEDIQRTEPTVRVLPYAHPFNYSAINNFGARHAKGDILGLVNNDIEVISPGWLGEMVSHAVRPEIGCVGAKLYYGDDTIQHAGVIVGLGGVASHSHKHFPRDAPGYFRRLQSVQNLSAVTAACLLIRTSVFWEVDGLDEDYLKVAFNDVDLCLKVCRAGYRNLWTPYAELYHHESISRGEENTLEKKSRFASEIKYMKKKWGSDLQVDPYYNKNLTLGREDFSINQDMID